MFAFKHYTGPAKIAVSAHMERRWGQSPISASGSTPVSRQGFKKRHSLISVCMDSFVWFKFQICCCRGCRSWFPQISQWPSACAGLCRRQKNRYLADNALQGLREGTQLERSVFVGDRKCFSSNYLIFPGNLFFWTISQSGGSTWTHSIYHQPDVGLWENHLAFISFHFSHLPGGNNCPSPA